MNSRPKGGAAYVPFLTQAGRMARRRRAAEMARMLPVLVVAERVPLSVPRIYQAMREFGVATCKPWRRKATVAA